MRPNPKFANRIIWLVIFFLFSSNSYSFAQTIEVTNFVSCRDLNEMNCVVSLVATFPDGSNIVGKPTGRINTWESTDFNQNSRAYKAEEWAIPGLVTSAGTNKVVSQVWIQNPQETSQGISYGALDMTLFASLWDAPQEQLKSPLCQNSGLTKPCLFPAQLPNDVKFTVVLNSNLLSPGFTSGSVAEASFTEKAIPGGFQYTISGNPIKIPVNLPDQKGTNPGDFPQALDDRNYWHLYTVDRRSLNFNWEGNKNCSIGNPIISSNAAQAGIPNYDPNTHEVTLQVSSPHLSADGITPEVGDFQARIPLSGISCLWGVSNNSLDSKAQISITYQDGTSSIASLVTGIKGEVFQINASGFHYSSPTIRLKFADVEQLKSTTKFAKLKVTCVKGKLTKVFSTASCPAGYKKK